MCKIQLRTLTIIWSANIILWASIIFTICAHTLNLSDSNKIGAYCWISISTAIYLIQAFLFSDFAFYFHQATPDNGYSALREIFHLLPKITFKMTCFHNPNYHPSILAKSQRTIKKIPTFRSNTLNSSKSLSSRIFTHRTEQIFKYLSSRDISGPLDLLKTNASFIKLYLEVSYFFAGKGTEYDYEKMKEKFQDENMKDIYNDFKEICKTDRKCTPVLLQICEENIWWIGFPQLILFTLLGLHAFYYTVTNIYYIEERFYPIKKMFSTRIELLSEESNKKFAYLNPIILLPNKIIRLYGTSKPPPVIEKFNKPFSFDNISAVLSQSTYMSTPKLSAEVVKKEILLVMPHGEENKADLFDEEFGNPNPIPYIIQEKNEEELMNI